MGTIYKNRTDLILADLNLECHKIKNLTHKLNEHSIRQASTLIKTRYALQYNLNNNSQGVDGTAHSPPDPHQFIFLSCVSWWGVALCEHLSNSLP
jgi:hypothetical protein